MTEYYLAGEIEKCSGCGGTGYTASENHPDCPRCSGAGYVKVEVREGEQ